MCTCVCVCEKEKAHVIFVCVCGWQTFLSDMENLLAKTEKNERKTTNY